MNEKEGGFAISEKQEVQKNAEWLRVRVEALRMLLEKKSALQTEKPVIELKNYRTKTGFRVGCTQKLLHSKTQGVELARRDQGDGFGGPPQG